jgi:YggT family protein
MILNFFALIIQLLLLAIFVRAILSWFPIGRDNPVVTIVFQITEPILVPIRRFLPSTGSIDLSPMVAMLLLILLRSLLLSV